MRTLFPALLALAVAVPAARAADPKETVAKALKATGWTDDGQSLRMTWKDDGAMTVGGTTLPYKATWAVQTPDRYRFDMAVEFGGKKQALAFVVGPDGVWEAADGQAREVTGDKKAYARNEAYTLWVTTLAPLVRDPKFTLTATADKTIGDRPAAGVKVERDGHQPLTLYFDKKTGLLAKYEGTVKDEFQGWKDVTDEVYYEGWKAIGGGVQAFAKVRLVRDGKPLVETAVSDFKVVDKLDPKLFEKP